MLMRLGGVVERAIGDGAVRKLYYLSTERLTANAITTVCYRLA